MSSRAASLGPGGSAGTMPAAEAATVAAAGFWSGMAAFAAVLAYDAAQALQIAGLLRFPLDERLIYGSSLCIVAPFLLLVLSLHHLTDGPSRFWTHAGLVFAILYAVFVTANYVVQLATVIPAKIDGTADAIRLLDQSPHSLFWNFDAIGYIAMGLAALLIVPALGNAGFERRAKASLLAHAAVTPLIGIVYFSRPFSERLLLLGAPWAVTAPLFMLMLAILVRNRGAAAWTRDVAAGKVPP